MLGFLPDALTLSSFDTFDEPALANGLPYRPCRNTIDTNTCNWMVPRDDAHDYCFSCCLNEVIPNLTEPRRLELWYEVEKAKRRLLYTLMSLRLPIEGKDKRPDGLAFRILSDERLDTQRATVDIVEPVTTGHYLGSITINLLEADHSMREEMREAMHESYRTLLGHFRHESGHYYWSRLVGGTQEIVEFRDRFGDETVDYGARLERHYADGAPADWNDNFVTAYASAHPYEDFAETWAHYLHMVDTLETAHDSDLHIAGRALDEPREHNDFDAILEDWTILAGVMNQLNRSMGLADAYPFAHGPKVKEKLRFLHRLIERR